MKDEEGKGKGDIYNLLQEEIQTENSEQSTEVNRKPEINIPLN